MSSGEAQYTSKRNRRTTPAPQLAPNVVVISDLHLGEDLTPGASQQTVRDVAKAEAALVDFLRHLARQRVDGRPWRLVINGDMADLMAVFIEPTALGPTDDLVRRHEDRDCGLGRFAAVAVSKVEAVVTRHYPVWQAAGRFVAAGNRLSIVIGNHDGELAFPEAQAALRDAICSAAADSPGGIDEAFEERVEFHPWFVHEPGVAWIEHGHQYDETCSFDALLHPTDGRGELIGNVDFAAVRYLKGCAPEVDAHGTDEWTFFGYLQFASGLGLRGFARMGRAYYRFARAILACWKAQRSLRGRALRRADHEAKLGVLARDASLDVKVLRNLDGLRRPPVVSSFARAARVAMLDRLSILGAAILATVLAFAVLPLGWAILATAAFQFGAHAVNHKLSERHKVDPTVALGLVPARIRQHIDVPFVVMGHTHDPMNVALPNGGTYFNTGTWLPATKPGLLRAFTHVVITRGANGPVASLRQWRDGASRAFTPDRVEALAVRAPTPPRGMAARAPSAPPVVAPPVAQAERKGPPIEPAAA